MATTRKQTPAEQTAAPEAEAAVPAAPTKVSNGDKRLLRAVMCERLQSITAAELKEAQPDLVDYPDEMLLSQVAAYIKYLLPEQVAK